MGVSCAIFHWRDSSYEIHPKTQWVYSISISSGSQAIPLTQYNGFKVLSATDLYNIDDTVSQAGIQPPLQHGQSLRLISSFTQTQSGDILPQLFRNTDNPQ